MEEFAEYMFLNNKNNRQIALSLEGIENNKDFFLFFIDLFSKGLVLCYGTNKSIDFDTLDQEKFDHIKKCMSAAGILISLKIEPTLTYTPTSINGPEIDELPEDLPISDYIFKIYKGSLVYQIQFLLTRN